MDLQPPAQVFSTTLYDRHQHGQSLSFIFVPVRSLPNRQVAELTAVKEVLEPNANYFKMIAASYLPVELGSLLSAQSGSNPFSWADQLPAALPTGGPIYIPPNSLGFAEYVAFSEVVPFEESPLKSKSLMSIAVRAGVTIGLIAGGATPFVLLTTPVGILLCTAGVLIGPALGAKIAQLIGIKLP